MRMKKYLLLLASIATMGFAATSCSDEKNDGGEDPDLTTPIELSGVVIPTFQESMKGANVTIQGKGFLGKDKIALTPRPSGTAVEIAPAEITASKLVFKFPSDLATSEEGWTLTLKRGTQSKEIGTMMPEDPEDPELTTPIELSDVVIPDFTESMKGASVTIDGKGFLGKDRVELKPVSGGDAVEVTNSEVTDAKLVFTFPDDLAIDEQGWTLTLKRGTQSKEFGTLKPVDPADDPDLNTPIELASLSVPSFVESMVGGNVTVTGRGFLGKDKIVLQPRSGGDAVETVSGEITDAKLVFAFPADLAVDAKGWVMTLKRGTQTQELGCFRSAVGRFMVPDAAFREYLQSLVPDNKYLFDEKGNAYKPDAAEVVFQDEVKYESTYKTLNLIDKAVTSVEGLEGFPDAANIKFFSLDNSKLQSLDMTLFPNCERLEARNTGTLETVNFGAVGVAPANELRYLHLNGNKIKRLDVSNVVKLCELTIMDNPLEYLDIRNMMANADGYMYLWKKPGRAAVNFEFTEDTSVERTLKVEYYWWRCVSQSNVDTVGAELTWVTDNPAIDALNAGVIVECWTYWGENGQPQTLMHTHNKNGENHEICDLYPGSLHP